MIKTQNNLLKDTIAWIISEIDSEYQYLSSKEKKFFDTYKLQSPTLYELQNKTLYDDSMFVVFQYKHHVILMDDIEELFSVGELKDNQVVYEGNFTSLKDAIGYLFIHEKIDFKYLGKNQYVS